MATVWATVHVATAVPRDHPWQRIVEAAALMPDGGAMTGWAALSWRGSRWFHGVESDGATHQPVPMAIGRDRAIRPRPGIRLCEEWLHDGDVRWIDGLPVTTGVRALSYEMRRARQPFEIVAIGDMGMFDDHCSIDELSEYVATALYGYPWTVQVRQALEHCDENCWSPRESTMRMSWSLEAGCPRPLCNVPIFAPDGTHLLTPDLFDPENGVVGEYDSLIHLEDGRRGRDVNREALVKDLGLEAVTMVTADNRSRAALRQPDWWVDTSTVARRRALDPMTRRRWLRRQAA